MNKIKKYAKWSAGIALLMIAGSVLHVPQWVAHAAGIYSTPVSNIVEAYQRPYQESFTVTACGTTNNSCAGLVATDVPSGYQLVIDHIGISVASGNTVTSMGGVLLNLSNSVIAAFPLVYGGDSGSTKNFVGIQTVHVTVPGGSLGVNAGAVGQNGATNFPTGDVFASVTGYLESCASYPGGTCPAIVDK